MNASRSILLLMVLACMPIPVTSAEQEANTTDWPNFRGNGGRGVASGFKMRTQWNADTTLGPVVGVKWETTVPGLGHSSPVVAGDKVFLLTAVSSGGQAELKVNAGGGRKAADDDGQQTWLVLCYDKQSGKEVWRRTAHKGEPKATRHTKATHANTSVSIQGDNLLAFFGSEGLYCYDLEGNLRWSRDLGVINISKYGIGWGFSSSPAIHKDRIAIVCDDPENPYVAALSLKDGTEVWRQSREDVCERSWGSPMIHASEHATQVVVNGWPWIVSYDLATGKERWRLKGGGDNPVPTPFEANGWIYITNAHGAQSPIYVIRPDASGNLSEVDSTEAKGELAETNAIVWSVQRGGSYMSTPVVYGDYLHLGNANGVMRCFHAKTGEKVYEKRLGKGAGVIASLVAADDKIFCASENGKVYVMKPGPEFEILAENEMSDACMATPAISGDILYVRTLKRLIAIQ